MFIQSRLRAAFRQLSLQSVPMPLLKQLLNFLLDTSITLSPFQPLQLAEKLSLGKREALHLILKGVLGGLFDMQWEVFCPRCHHSIHSSALLPEVPDTDKCPECHAAFENFADQNVQVLISVHPGLLQSPSSINKQKSHPYSYPPTTALDFISLPLFREKFGNHLMGVHESLKVRRVTVVFTDLIQSTALYEQIGDITAFQLVNDHFQTLFKEIIHHQGGIVKTIGDSVMAILPTPADALKAAYHAKMAVHLMLSKQNLPLQSGLKIGIHAGPALIVNLNNTFDLFGTTINIGARLVSLSTFSTIAMSRDVAEDPEIHQFLTEHHLSALNRSIILKGFQKPYPIVLVKI